MIIGEIGLIILSGVLINFPNKFENKNVQYHVGSRVVVGLAPDRRKSFRSKGLWQKSPAPLAVSPFIVRG